MPAASWNHFLRPAQNDWQLASLGSFLSVGFTVPGKTVTKQQVPPNDNSPQFQQK
jgi:hypothetical protein